MPPDVSDLLKDVLFTKLMEEVIPLDMKKATEYAKEQDDLIKSFHDPKFFDTKYYGALSNALAKTQMTGIIKNMSGELDDKALRITVYIFLKQHLLLNLKNIEHGIRDHPDLMSNEDIKKADEIAQKLFEGVENSPDYIISKEFK